VSQIITSLSRSDLAVVTLTIVIMGMVGFVDGKRMRSADDVARGRHAVDFDGDDARAAVVFGGLLGGEGFVDGGGANEFAGLVVVEVLGGLVSGTQPASEVSHGDNPVFIVVSHKDSVGFIAAGGEAAGVF
jgi:hypothetical protein